MADYLASIYGTEKDKCALVNMSVLRGTDGCVHWQGQLLLFFQDGRMPARRQVLAAAHARDL